MENHTTSFQNRDCRDIKQPEVLSGNKKTPDKRIPSNASSSSSDMEVQLSDVDVYQMYANSNSSGFSEMQSSSSEAGKSKDGNYDDENNCIPLINGSIVLSLMEAKMWHKFLELGTEMIINRSGRRMFPYVEFFLKGVDPAGLYDVMFDIIPASSKSFKFLNNKWIPIGKKDEEFKNHPFKHPDSPRIGSDWMSRKISFEKIKLSNNPDTCTKDGIFTLHTFQKYFVSIYIVKHEEDDELSVMDFPIRATTFIAVTAYNNRKVTKLKINSNPYSKGFRFPVKRLGIHTFEELDNKGERLVTYDDCVKNSLYCHPDEIPISLQPNSHTFVELNNEVERPVTYDDCVKNSIFCHPDEIPVTLH
ncbi:T-box protein 12-like [Ostrea edulis]|uniref:T-box protein 12-like n=1 Tax=Ostrea edulis TaxID=37623 RepID=UPI0024AFB771|nr:T-box protein 12-like [Ostrea edulis]